MTVGGADGASVGIFVIFLGRVGDGDGDGDDRRITDDGEDSGDSEDGLVTVWKC